jgi:DNA repair exonuclease SbcCD ATPase subunit
MGLDETVKDLEAKLARVEKELSDLKDKSQKELQKLRSDLTKFDQVEKDVSKFQDETKKDIDQFRLDSIQTLRDLPGNIADSESKMLDKQNRGLTLALSRQNWSLAAASILIALIGGAFTWWINKQLAEFDQKTTTVTNLLEDLQSAPDLAYQRLKKEEIFSVFQYIKNNPDAIGSAYFRSCSTRSPAAT